MTDPVREEMIPIAVKYHNAMTELERLTRLYPEGNERITEMLRQINENFTSGLLRVIRGYSNPTVEEFGKDGVLERRRLWKHTLESLPEEVKR